MENLTQISIYIKENSERVNEVTLFQPLNKKAQFDEDSKPVQQRNWNFSSLMSPLDRFVVKIKTFMLHLFPAFIPKYRLSAEAKFKTVLSMLLAQESLREYFLNHKERKKQFLAACSSTAKLLGYQDFIFPIGETAFEISKELTRFSGRPLVENISELNIQIGALSYEERNEILFDILNYLERPPLNSVLEIIQNDAVSTIEITTQYAKCHIFDFQKLEGKICYHFSYNRATSSINTWGNSAPGAKGVANQRVVKDSAENTWIGSYSGELCSKEHVLEQLLLLLDLHQGEIQILKEKNHEFIEKNILFTSLFSWNEYGAILDQHAAIQHWNKLHIKPGGNHQIALNLLHMNIPFNAFNKYPAPAEINAKINDINDFALLTLVGDAFCKLKLDHPKLSELLKTKEKILCLKDDNFFKKEGLSQTLVDQFRSFKKSLLTALSTRSCHFSNALQAVIAQKKPDGHPLKGIDFLLYLDIITKELGYLHNKNCLHSTDRSAGADAADKAQHAFNKILKRPFMPGSSIEDEKAFFQILYSMYLVWEEPELNAALSTGFIGEKFHRNFFQKNPETTRYLIKWLQHHPTLYLGLSNYRT